MNYHLLLESLLYYSPKFRQTLYKLKHEISKDLLSIEGDNITPDLTFIDIDDEGNITFSQMDKAVQKIDKHMVGKTQVDKLWQREVGDMIYNADLKGTGPGIFTDKRNVIKLGKLVKNIFKDKYTDKEIEDFINNFKSLKSQEKIELWSGKMIAKAYDSNEYKYKVGTLGNSCMNDKFNFLTLYYNNPETCRVAVLLENDKIVARAIVWKIKSAHEFYDRHNRKRYNKVNIPYLLDRVYSTDDYMVLKMTRWAENQGWASKYYNNSSEKDVIHFNGKKMYCELQVEANPPNGESFPYMDTFTRYDIQKKTLYNDSDTKKVGHILYSVCGGYESKFYPKSRLLQRFKDFIRR
jgi:hypothetical protein